MAFGFSPKHHENITLTGSTDEELLHMALETVKKLNWDIGDIHKTKFVAYTKFSLLSWGEEVSIDIKNGTISLKSECTGNQITDWGKNKKNVTQFMAMFDTLKNEFSIHPVESKPSELGKNFVAEEEEEVIMPSPLSQKEKMSGFLSFFRPTEGYYITPIVVNINIVVFIIMVMFGVNILLPDNESLLLLGANYQPVTLDGQWWRLLSSCFLHIGIFHLLMNMYALVYIGLMLEPYIGRLRFLSAYILTGIAGSTVSLYWNDPIISAGASGAIFGMYGVFIALLTTNLIEKSAKKSLLISILFFVGYNIFYGLKGGIDNAAHIGGLITGLLIGYSFYPGLIKPNVPKLKTATVTLLSALILVFSLTVLTTTPPSEIDKYNKEIEQFVLLEEKAMLLIDKFYDPSYRNDIHEIAETGVGYWNDCIRLIDKLNQYVLPDKIHYRNTRLKFYCQLRIKSFETMAKAAAEDTNAYNNKIDNYNFAIDELINELSRN
jgi:rhomboid protease GluP